jgi:DNA-directed RNA polymerase subunit RPC12/RpoP
MELDDKYRCGDCSSEMLSEALTIAKRYPTWVGDVFE